MIVNNDVAFGVGLNPADFAAPSEETDEMGRSLRARRRARRKKRVARRARRRDRHLKRMGVQTGTQNRKAPRMSPADNQRMWPADIQALRERLKVNQQNMPSVAPVGMQAAADIDDVEDLPAELDDKNRPGWVIPVAVGGGVLVLAGGALYLKKRGAK